ncbi:transposase-like protein%2C IS1167 [Streptococcus pneumoniae]|nr:transposase-like protein%2C IS1167 [Streptococcus pneumoniae]CVM68465.1 transposase-like protein%2C IS1167 [Streptococcus pneumoniae]CWJ10013.1 transposase-like protein%2C IS1167 [Streptococcus pneumoniae]
MEQLHFITKLLDIKDPNIQILDKLLSYSEDLKHHYQLYQLLLFHFQNKKPEKFFGLIEDNLKQVHPIFQTVFKTFLKDKEKIVNALQLHYSNARPIISSNLSSAMPLVFGTLKTSKNGFSSL